MSFLQMKKTFHKKYGFRKERCDTMLELRGRWLIWHHRNALSWPVHETLVCVRFTGIVRICDKKCVKVMILLILERQV